ncbi:protein TIFY 4B-like [Wolffia australiana]
MAGAEAEEEGRASEAPSALKSPLEKPLGELTEEDIAQVTREDCRRFLKEKGMRRPSWNKSQAVQQVISLKALLEVRDADDAAPAVVSALFESPVDVLRPPTTGQIFSRSDELPHSRAGELTIFYDGKIRVYKGVTPEKAQAILQVAGSRGGFDVAPTSSSYPFCSSQPSKYHQQSLQGLPSSALPQTENQHLHFRDGLEEFPSQRETDHEGPASRAASLQRYLEKRKDRFKSKKISAVAASHVDFFTQRMGEIYPAAAAPPRTTLRISIDINDNA